MNRLLILSHNADDYVSLLSGFTLDDIEIHVSRTVEEASLVLPKCNLVLGSPVMLAPLLDKAPQLQWVQSTWAGVDALCKSGLRTDYLLTGVKEVFGPSKPTRETRWT